MSETKMSPQAQQLFDGPDELGHFGPYGGVFVGETLIAAVEELAEVYRDLGLMVYNPAQSQMSKRPRQIIIRVQLMQWI